jgi:hypothetical protein
MAQWYFNVYSVINKYIGVLTKSTHFCMDKHSENASVTEQEGGVSKLFSKCAL